MKFRVLCPAKLNLYLAVGARDARGYHPVRTVMQTISLFDILEVEIGDSATPQIHLEGAELPADNTLTKAHRLSREVFAISASSIRLQKNIPMEAGLGGGSSDAAGLLRAYNHVFAASPAELESVAAAVGMDVPFFLTGGRALGEGYGERITPLPDPPEEWYLVVKPPIGCATAEMYAKLDALPNRATETPDDASNLYNDFERVAPCECLDLIERLKANGARDASLSGSGSAVFGRFPVEPSAQAAKVRIDREGLGESWVAQSLTRTGSLQIDA